MDEKKNLKVGNTYRYSNRAKEFMSYIAKAERKKLEEALATTKFLSVMSDSLTDSTVIEDNLVYVRWATAGKMKVCFVNIQSVDKRDASHIAEVISSIMETMSGSEDETGQWLQKLVACRTDSAAVMTGQERSSQPATRRQRAHSGHTLHVHSAALSLLGHRFEQFGKES